jgi:maleamate amidohydrolase
MSPIWDAFLTDRDLAHLAQGWQKTQPFGLGARAAVLVIDDERSILGDEELPLLEATTTAIMRFGKEGWDALRRTDDLLQAARAVGVPIIFTVNGGGVSGRGLFRSASHLAGAAPPDRGDPADEIHPLVSTAPSDYFLRKGGASAFFCTPLVSHLIGLGIDSVLICGNSTSGCVRASAVDCSSYSFKTAVIEDCTFDRTEASHAMNLFDLNQKYADVMSSRDAISYLDSVRAPVTADAN